MDYERMAYRKRRRRKRRLQKLIPPLVAIFLIALVGFISFKAGLFEGMFDSTEHADLYKYFGAIGDDYAVIIEDRDDPEAARRQLKVVDGVMYQDLGSVKEEYNDRFYFDLNDNALLYTTSQEVISVPVGATSYTSGGNTVQTPYTICMQDKEDLLVALDYVQLYADFAYDLYGGNGEPYRAHIRKEEESRSVATLTKDRPIRIDMDRKSDILRDMNEGDKLIVLDEATDWCKVQTEDLITGYIETKYLGETTTESVPAPPKHTEPAFSYITREGPVRLIWDMVTNTDANAGLKQRLSGQQGLTVVSPTWFFVADNEGTVESIASRDYVNTAHDMGLEVWGLVENITYNADLKMYNILSYSAKRAFLIEQLMQYAQEFGLDGINVDFETVPQEAGESYVQFIRELSLACRKAGIVLSVDNFVPTPATEHYNRDQQGLFADYIIIMGYDEHYSSSEESGSVASINFVIDGITKTIEEVPAERVINAVPLYTRIWIETPKTDTELAAEDPNAEFIPYSLDVRTVSMGDAKATLADVGTEAKWDEETQQNYAEWQKGERTYKVWMEDGDSLAAKIQAMHNFHLGGIAAWQLSYANETAWNALAQF
ncbi:MAG: SH3 domain-containing protein [Lachnospiraceae bacterium]|nr:SH3 domain-containing protein [Lachnospiraceae bacterium]